MSNLKNLNNLVLSFFEENFSEENVSLEKFEELWMDEDMQNNLRELCVMKYVKHKKKDPNAPKRGKSSYLFFCIDNREQVKNKLGEDAKATDITRELGVLWNKLKNSNKASDKKKIEKYVNAAKEDKSRYEEEKKLYVPPSEDEIPKYRGKKKKYKSNKKRPKSAYLLFCSDMREQVKSENPTYKPTEVTSRLGILWNKLKNSDKASDKKKMETYVNAAKEERNQYEEEQKE